MKTENQEKTPSIPKDYSSITPYLIVNDGDKAILFYKQAFNAIEILRIERENKRIGHAELRIGDSKIMVGENGQGKSADILPKNDDFFVGFYLYVENVDVVCEQAVNLGAKLLKPIENTYYGDRIGSIKDPFGHTWFISTRIENVPTEEIQKRANKLFEGKYTASK